MEDALGFPFTPKGSIDSDASSEDNVPCSGTRSFLILVQNKIVFTTENLIFCHYQAQAVLSPYDFLLLRVLGSNRRGHHNDLGILFLEL